MSTQSYFSSSRFPLAHGLMGMSGMYGAADDAESIATIRAAIDSGVTLFDTGDFYGMGHNEMLLGRALREAGSSVRDRVQISVKFGALRSPSGAWIGLDTRPEAVKNFLAYSLVRLGVDHIDLYRPARFNPLAGVPLEDTLGAIRELVDAGYVRRAALSEVSEDSIRRAHAVLPIADVQMEYSLLSRGAEASLFPLLQELGIALTAYGVLSRGLLSGSRPQGANDFRAHLPRFSEENLSHNQLLVARLEAFAQQRQISPTQAAIAWTIAQGKQLGVEVIPLIGARKRSQLAESLAAAKIVLPEQDLAELNAIFPPDAAAGSRYDEHQMAMLDSERK